METRRDRILKALTFIQTDQVPLDLGAMPSTNVSCFAYPDLIQALGLPPRPPRVYDTMQMLALPETDVLDALDCDVVTLGMDFTNAFDQPELWHPYDFGGRLPSLVRDPKMFEAQPDGTILQPGAKSKMPTTSHVFETEHGGQPLMLSGDIPKPDLAEVKRDLEKNRIRAEQLPAIRELFQKARAATDRAIMLVGPTAGISIHGFTGVAMFPMLCMTEPEFVAELHEMVVQATIENLEILLPEVGDCFDILMCNADDWGTQNAPIASPVIFDQLFKPYYTRMNSTVHRLAPNVKTYLHSCGAIYDLIDMIIECGFDILNPVQWTAGGHSYKEWKDKARNRIALWGGGVNTQTTLPLGTVEDIEREVKEIVEYMRQDGGFVFCAIHNILAEIPGEKVVAMYKAARSVIELIGRIGRI